MIQSVNDLCSGDYEWFTFGSLAFTFYGGKEFLHERSSASNYYNYFSFKTPIKCSASTTTKGFCLLRLIISKGS